ncbi:hypothetical protein PR048_031826, partial [Dryococelus australis]
MQWIKNAPHIPSEDGHVVDNVFYATLDIYGVTAHVIQFVDEDLKGRFANLWLLKDLRTNSHIILAMYRDRKGDAVFVQVARTRRLRFNILNTRGLFAQTIVFSFAVILLCDFHFISFSP